MTFGDHLAEDYKLALNEAYGGPELTCRGFWFIGSAVCDRCGEPPAKHEGYWRLRRNVSLKISGKAWDTDMYELVPWEKGG